MLWSGARNVALMAPDGLRRARFQGRERPVVGDLVALTPGAEPYRVAHIAPRKSVLLRRSAHGRREQVLAANLDTLGIVTAPASQWSPGLVDRLLVAAAVGGAKPLLIVNKCDLAAVDTSVREDLEIYAGLGLPALLTSAITGEGLEALKGALVGRVTALAGHSGVGKSSLLNVLVPSAARQTGDLSARKGTGRHITSSARGFPFDGGGMLIDMPGVRLFGMVALEPVELAAGFVEIAPHAIDCRFPNCTHSHEPACAVREAVARGEVTARRYRSYLRLLDETAAH